MVNVDRILQSDAAVRGLKLRTVKGLFGIPMGQFYDPRTKQWVFTAPGQYERLLQTKNNYISGTNLNVAQQVIRRVSDEFKRLEGMALDDSQYTTIICRMYPGLLKTANITADELQIFEDAGNRALSMLKKPPASYDDTAVEDWAEAVAYGVLVLSALKNQHTLLKLQPAVTRQDDSPLYPYTRATLVSALISLKGLRIPPVCYPIAELFTRIIQVGGAEKLNGIDSQYLVPCQHGLTFALFEDQIDALDSLQKANLFGTYIGKPSVPIYENWIKTPKIVPFYSDYAQAICDMLPVESNSGGVAQHAEDWDSNINCYYNQTIGMNQIFSAAPLFREDTGAATSAVFQIIGEPAADKLSFSYFADRTVTTPVAFPDNSARLDYIFQVSEARSSEHRGIFGHGENFMQYHTINGDESSWDRRCSGWIASKVFQPKIPVGVLARLLPSLVSPLQKPGVKLATASQSNYGNKVK